MVYQAKQSELSIFQRIASGGENTVMKAIEMLSQYGYEKPTTRKELSLALAKMVSDQGEKAANKLALIHPDYEFIVSNYAPPLPDNYPDFSRGLAEFNGLINGRFGGRYKNDCGCHHNDVGTLSAATTTAQNEKQKSELMIFAVVMVLGLGGIAFLSMIANQTIIALRQNK